MDNLEEVQKMRLEWKKNDDHRDLGLPTNPQGVKRYNDISYGDSGVSNLLDVYEPKNITDKLPVIVNCHGGGYFYGTKETYQFYGLDWAKRGFAFVNFNYRLAPETTFPGALQDTDKVMQWVTKNADEYDFDLSRVFLVGDSAGGNMVFQFMTTYSNTNYRDWFGFKELDKVNILGAAMNCGVYFLNRPGAITGSVNSYFTDQVQKDMHEQMTPQNYIDSTVPPLYVMSANQDFLHDEAIRMDQFLVDSNIKHQFKIYGDNDNPRGHVFHVNMRDDVARSCNNDEQNFFESLM